MPTATTTRKKSNSAKVTVKGGTAAKTATAPKPRTAKQDVKTSVLITLNRSGDEPKGSGGVRFNQTGFEKSRKGKHIFYLHQEQDAMLGSPDAITLTVAAKK